VLTRSEDTRLRQREVAPNFQASRRKSRLAGIVNQALRPAELKYPRSIFGERCSQCLYRSTGLSSRANLPISPGSAERWQGTFFTFLNSGRHCERERPLQLRNRNPGHRTQSRLRALLSGVVRSPHRADASRSKKVFQNSSRC